MFLEAGAFTHYLTLSTVSSWLRSLSVLGTQGPSTLRAPSVQGVLSCFKKKFWVGGRNHSTPALATAAQACVCRKLAWEGSQGSEVGAGILVPHGCVLLGVRSKRAAETRSVPARWLWCGLARSPSSRTQRNPVSPPFSRRPL